MAPGISDAHIERIGAFSLGWGESLVWDDRRDRLYFVDCAAQTLHWLESDGAALDPELHTMQLPSMGAGVVPCEDGSLIIALDDGLHVVDPDAGTTYVLAAYPSEMHGRANDACADLAGNLITGKLNLGPAEGSAWWYSPHLGWRLLDPRISNTNGPAAGVIDGTMTLIIGDTATNYYAYPYDDSSGSVGERAVFGDLADLAGLADGATLDSEGGLWCALVQGGQLARFVSGHLDGTIELPVANPTDVTFGGPLLDRVYVVSIGPGTDDGTLDGALLAVTGLQQTGRLEPRFRT